MNRRAVAATLASLLTFAISTTATAPASGVPAADVTRVRLSGDLITTSAEPGQPSHAAIRTSGGLVPVEAKDVAHVAPGSGVTLDLAVPTTVTRSASSTSPLVTPNGDGTSDRHSVTSKDLAAASDSTPASASTVIGRATIAVATGPEGTPLDVDRVVSVTGPEAASYRPATRRVVAVSVAPAGVTGTLPTHSEIINAVNSAGTFWQANSRDELSVSLTQITTGVTTGYSCSNPFGLWNHMAQETGWSWSEDTSLVVFLPAGADQQGCSYGLGTIGGSPNSGGYAYVSSPNRDVVAHEVGHNMSLQHADALVCGSSSDGAFTNGTWSDGCQVNGYGDGQDVMGIDNPSLSSGLLSTPQAIRTGMLEEAAIQRVGTGTTTVTLQPLAGRTGTRAATVTHADTGVTYYVEYRTPAGHDAHNAWGQSTGVRVLRMDPADDGTLLLDPTPTGSFYDRDPVLTPGRSLTTAGGGLRFATISADNDQAVVRITNTVGIPSLANTSAPTISGTPIVGSTLTATDGSWTPAPDTVTFQWLRDGSAIAGATTATYRPTSDDVGSTLTVEATASKSGYGDASAVSAGVTLALPPFAEKGTARITGTPKVWADLTVDTGTWSPTPTSFTYEWRVDGVASFFGTEETYAVWPDDAGREVSVKVTAHRDGYADASVVSDPVTIPLQEFHLFTRPEITGTPSVGSTLTATGGTWSPSPSSTTYQWKRDGQDIVGATTKTYVPTTDDAGTALTVSVTVTRDGYADRSSTSAAANIPLGTFTPGARPSISGTPRVASELTATAGEWTPAPTGTTYQWRRDGQSIAGATSRSYTPTEADAGRDLTVTVTATSEGYASASSTSAAVTVPELTFTMLTRPSLAGTPRVGTQMTADSGSWSPTPTAFTYQWLRNGAAISGATGRTYTPTATDAGRDLGVRVTVTRAGHTSQTVTSDALRVPTVNFSASPTPKITGTKGVGKTLTASAGTWSPTPSTLSYQWKRNGKTISGATSRTYVPTTADAGRYLTVTVTARRTGYTTKSTTSAKAGIPIHAKVRPSITGTAAAGKRLTISVGTWTPTPTSYSYRWYRNGVAISGATAKTYTVRSIDKGKKLHATVTVRRKGYVTGSQNTASRSVAR